MFFENNDNVLIGKRIKTFGGKDKDLLGEKDNYLLWKG
jgi:hypothetical protein